MIDVETMLRYGRFILYGTGRWTVYSVKSDPNNEDTDGDGAWDDVDEFPMRKNGRINYVLIGKDNPGKDALESMRLPYVRAFEEQGEDVIVLDIWDDSDFDKKVKDFEGEDLEPYALLQFFF